MKYRAFALLVIGIIGVWIIFSNRPKTSQIEDTPATYPTVKITYEKAVLVCDECEEMNMLINIWNTPSREGIAGQVGNKTVVDILGTEMYSGILHYRVQTGSVTGWVSELFIQK